jgi:hypothetical protein
LEYPTSPFGAGAVPSTTQPALTGFEAFAPVAPAPAEAPAREARLRPVAANTERQAERRGARRRYWSVRDLSRRIWYGRGYELLRHLIRAGVLPASRSTHSWWVDDEDVQGLLAAFDDRAGKVRAFRGLEAWLRERCWVAPLTVETEALLGDGQLGVAWRGNAYLPKQAWRPDFAADGHVTYFHQSGATIPPAADLAA